MELNVINSFADESTHRVRSAACWAEVEFDWKSEPCPAGWRSAGWAPAGFKPQHRAGSELLPKFPFPESRKKEKALADGKGLLKEAKDTPIFDSLEAGGVDGLQLGGIQQAHIARADGVQGRGIQGIAQPQVAFNCCWGLETQLMWWI